VSDWKWTEEFSPAERSAAWVIEEWLTDEPTFRHLAARWTSRETLYDAYRARLSTIDNPAALRFAQGMPGLFTDFDYDEPARPAVLRGPTAGTLTAAGPRTFIRTARLYLMESVVHGSRGWMGVGMWRGLPIYLDRSRRTSSATCFRDRTLLRPGDAPLWSR
jgi:hypothetical protein